MRIKVVIDDLVMDAALKATGLTTRKNVIESGLKLLIQISNQKAIREYRGKLKWHGDLNKMRLDL
jgi:Arc/MetJ family transcription regulator